MLHLIGAVIIATYLFLFSRENEQFALNFDDLFCHSIIKAIKSQKAIADPHMTSSIDLELEPSTPDNGVEPMRVVSHLAEQEHSFSDESTEFSPEIVLGSRTSPFLETRIVTNVVSSADDNDDDDDDGVDDDGDNDRLEGVPMLEDEFDQRSSEVNADLDEAPEIVYADDKS